MSTEKAAAAPDAAEGSDEADSEETDDQGAVGGPAYLGEPGPPLDHRAPFYVGFVGATGALVAFWLLTNIQAIGNTLILILVSLFLAAGLNPAVSFFERRGLRRGYAVLVVIICVVVAVVLFLVAIVPVITDQVKSITDQAPTWSFASAVLENFSATATGPAAAAAPSSALLLSFSRSAEFSLIFILGASPVAWS